MHPVPRLVLSPGTTRFFIDSLRDIPSPIASSPCTALNKLEGRTAKVSQGTTDQPQVAALVDSYQDTNLFLRHQAFRNFQKATMSRFPALQVNGLSSVSEDPMSATTPTERTADREAKRLEMLRRMRPPPFRYAWAFYHDKYSETSSYDDRITLVLGDIVTIKPMWGFLNNFPLNALKLKDSVHFFKRGIKPVWEDSRNINGGSWTFRISKDKSEQFWQEVLMLAVGDRFAKNLQPRDDICGLSFITRFNSNLITIWNRDGTNQASIDGILSTVLGEISDEARPKDGSYFYKKHSEHAGFEEAVAKAKADAQAKIDRSEAKKKAVEDAKKVESGEEDEALVTEEEGNKAMLKDAEGEDMERIDKER